MEFCNLSNLVLAGVLSYFDSCYLGMIAMFLRKDISIHEAFVLMEIHVSDINFSTNKKKVFLKWDSIIYNDDSKEINIKIFIDTNTIVINSYLLKEDEKYLNSIVEFGKNK